MQWLNRLMKELKTNNYHLRIKKQKEIDMFNECMELGRFNTLNDLFNLCLEIALPQILESPMITSNSVKTNLKNMENKIVSKIDRELKVVKKEIAKQLILAQLNEDMISTLFQTFIYFLKTQNINIDQTLISSFAQSLPESFSKLKDLYIKNMLNN